MSKVIIILLLLSFLLINCTKQVPEADDVVEDYVPPATSVVDKQFNFHIVDGGVWRSSQPNSESITRMKRHGLKTILNLRGDKKTDNWEGKLADSLGLNYFSRPIDSREKQDLNYLKEILSIVEDTTNQPVLIHCLGGKDRTGLITGMYKLKHTNIPLAQIKKEIIMYGHDSTNFHEIFNGLDTYNEEIRNNEIRTR